MSFVHDYVFPTILASIPILAGLFVNRKYNKKDIIPCLIDTPKEILLLCMGFVVTYTAKSTNVVQSTNGTGMILLSFVLIFFVYALRECANQQYLDLANNEEHKVRKIIWLSLKITASWVTVVYFFVMCLNCCLGGE